ncbi:hypothetical protein C2S51_014653 [Perilla frutescens var. frutescens]|nr:hypothetical protein C2S51_014653 [Perilla frutescens var. frutescens]
MSPSLLPFFFTVSLLSTIIIISTTSITHSYSQCLDDQKTLLLELKNELIFDSSISEKLVQWNQTDECCSWYGVECDGAGYVISLQLDDEAISGGIRDSSSLFRLKYLEKLNLAYNDFNFTQIPRAIQSLSYLTHLNLSNAAFGGQVPLELSLLRRLVSLDISTHGLGYEYSLGLRNNPLKLESPTLEMLIQNLTGLRVLYLDRVDISSEKSEWSHIISSYLPDLTSLSLRYCGVSGPLGSLLQLDSLSVLQLDGNNLSTQVPDSFGNFSSLTTLSLSDCSLEGSLPKMIFQIPSLQILDLSYNQLLSGTIPPFPQNGSSLQSIMLSNTNFSGSIPSSISNLKTLSHIDLSSCEFTGPIPSTFANLTELIGVDLGGNFFTGSLSSTLFGALSNLFYLNLGSNSFTGNMPQSLFGLPSLQSLSLGLNKFIGQVEGFPFVNVSSISYLDLSSNRLEGPIPYSLLQFQSLRYVDLSHNLFNGTIQLEKFLSLPNLAFLVLSHNNLSVNTNNVNSSSSFPLLRKLGLASCNLFNIPYFIKHTDMAILDLSKNRIAGQIPSWLWGVGRQFYDMNLSSNLLTGFEKPFQIPASFNELDFSSNQLQGELHLPISKLEVPLGNQSSILFFLSLANNRLNGSIPTSLCNATCLYLLDLSRNQFSGDVPPCLLQNIQNLEVFNLGNNNISGHIPEIFSLNCKLRTFDLQNNALEGKIPKSLESCKSLELINVGKNIIHDIFPCMLPPSLRVIVLRSNRFYGEVTCQTSWPNLQIVDISSNNFSGALESINFSSWRAMVRESNAQLRLNRSGSNFLQASNFYYPVGVEVTLKGLEVELVKIWPDFVAIDFSSNNFQGEIPNAIGDLSSLYLLNLSHNALNGSIPKSLGKLRDLGSLDLSQNQLTGTIPVELAGLTFLSFLNLSYNKLVGKIPSGPQLQTFSEDSFEGNEGLCGTLVNRSCIDDKSPPEHQSGQSQGKKEIEWEYVGGALGYVVGLGSFIWVLLYCQNFRHRYFEQLDEVFDKMFDCIDRRRRAWKRKSCEESS